MAGFTGDWNSIETDSQVFTQVLKRIGTKGVQVEELWSLEDNVLNNLRPIHGIVLLLKFIPSEESSAPVVTDDRLSTIYFTNQVISNACPTQAMVTLLLNCNHPDIDIGPELTRLKELTLVFDPKMRALAISNSLVLRNAHNSLSQRGHFRLQSLKNSDSYYFIIYMPVDGRVYEMNSLRSGPIDHGQVPAGKDWLTVVQSTIIKKVTEYNENEDDFNLMALVSDRKMMYQRQIHEILTKSSLYGMQPHEVQNEVPKLKMLIQYENLKMTRYHQEIIRRKHNYEPFIIALLKMLLDKKKIGAVLEKARERAQRRGLKRLKV